MQCLQISHPRIIIDAVSGVTVEQLILLTPFENEDLLFFNQIRLLFSHLVVFV